MNILENVPDTVRETYDLHLEGKSIREIAKLRGLKKSTIYSHFENLIFNKFIELDNIVDLDKREEILAVLKDKEKELTGLKSIKDQLDESISYEEIRCVLAFVKSQVQLDKQKKSTNNAFERELTDSAKHILKEKIPINLHLLAKNEIVPKPENLGILSELKTWRKNIASEKNIPPYCVFHDSTLISIANQLPKTKKELKMIKGVGIRKIESYGEDILKITSGYDQLASISNSRIREIKTYNRELHEKVKKETPESLKLEIFTVGELTKYIKNLLESDRNLTNLWVRGEISNLRQHASGHIYFSLKDEESQIRCVIFRRVGDYLNFKLEHGMKIVVRGNVEVYEPYGEYSIIIEEVQPDGLGALNLAFIQLKNKLEKEGLFSSEHKKSLPKFPKIIGIITSSTGAAIQDILNIIKRRYPLVRILIVPTVVQGKEAASSIIESIELMNELSYVDVIILGRGGGSLEDIWCFNEEIVARAIFKSKIPIISAVGHETDFTIADFVADYRAPTPSAAAEKVVPDIQELYEVIDNFNIRGLQAIRHIIELHKSHLKQITNRPIFRRPFDRIHSYYRELDHTTYKLQTTLIKNITSKRRELEIIESKIITLSPESVLKRGYSIIMKGNKTVKSFSDVKVNDNINVILHKGKLDAQVKKIQRD